MTQGEENALRTKIRVKTIDHITTTRLLNNPQAVGFYSSTTFANDDGKNLTERQEEGSYHEFAININCDNNPFILHPDRTKNLSKLKSSSNKSERKLIQHDMRKTDYLLTRKVGN